MYISFFCLDSNGLSNPGGVIEFNYDGASKNKPSAGRTQPYSVPKNAARSTFGSDCYPYPKSHLAFLAPDLFTCAFTQISDRDRAETMNHVLASVTSVADNIDGNFFSFYFIFFRFTLFFSLPPPFFYVFLSVPGLFPRFPQKKENYKKIFFLRHQKFHELFSFISSSRPSQIGLFILSFQTFFSAPGNIFL